MRVETIGASVGDDATCAPLVKGLSGPGPCIAEMVRRGAVDCGREGEILAVVVGILAAVAGAEGGYGVGTIAGLGAFGLVGGAAVADAIDGRYGCVAQDALADRGGHRGRAGQVRRGQLYGAVGADRLLDQVVLGPVAVCWFAGLPERPWRWQRRI